ncbi:MAG TPA: oligoendopeptidase F [Chloroflexi bacterium]|nr:MAG: oligoendopeptidase F [Chloroflexota bacterium]HDD55681.1 oligoendopeptidase F [Chloroflexota bacterium]
MALAQLPARNEVPREQTWNLESIFPELNAWEESYHSLEKRLPEFEAYKGKLAQSPEVLLACLKLREEVLRGAEKVAVYSGLDSATDASDQEAQARSGQGRGLMNKAVAEAAFIEPELLALGWEVLKSWMAEEPALAVYQHYFENLFRLQSHLRSTEVEEVLALAADPLGYLSGAYGSLVNADITFKPAVAEDSNAREVGQSSINGLITDPDREVRRTAWENYADGYLEHQNTIAATQAGVFKRDVFRARARRYGSSLEASLSPNNIPTEVFYNLIQVFKDNLPTWHRYWRIRKEILGYDQLHVYDIKAPLTTSKPLIPYQQAVDWICEGMAPLGEEYVEILRKGCLEDRWVDRALNKNKGQGAFSWGMHDTQPFIMMSYADDVFSLSTLAHELGHSLHSYYTWQNQPYIYGDYSLFVAEVASNFNQAMVREYLFQTQKDPDLQMALIEETMSNYHRYFFIMPTLARFEIEMHERAERGEPINARSMIELTADLFREGYGDEVVFDQNRIGITWAQFGHMYANFYVYQYATGISGANALVNRVLAEGEPAAAEYLDFLKAGNSLYSLDALQRAGVDLTSPEPVKAGFKFLADTVDRLEKIA